MRGGGVDSGDEFAWREGQWWMGGADVCVAGACAGEVMTVPNESPRYLTRRISTDIKPISAVITEYGLLTETNDS